jgi:hypothetical protein
MTKNYKSDVAGVLYFLTFGKDGISQETDGVKYGQVKKTSPNGGSLDKRNSKA